MLYQGMTVLVFHENQGAGDELQKLLEETMEGISVTSTASLNEAQSLIGQTVYDVVVLNRLRLSPTLAISDRICEQLGPGLVIHLIGYPRNEMRDHIIESHTGPEQPYGICIDHLDHQWPSQLIQRIQGYLTSWLIRGRLDELFGPDPQDRAARRNPLPHSAWGGRHASPRDIPLLCQHASQNWELLDEQLQRRLIRSFHVDISTTPVRIGWS